MRHLKLFEEISDIKKKVLILHGYGSSNKSDFHPWLKSELESLNIEVLLPNLPTVKKGIDDQVNFLIEKYSDDFKLGKINIVAHSLGCVTALKLIEKLNYKIESLLLISGFVDTNFYEGDEDIENLANVCDWKFNFPKIKKNFNKAFILYPYDDSSVTFKQTKDLSKLLNTPIHRFKSKEDHACGKQEPGILKFLKMNII